MWQYIIKRILKMIPTLIIISIILFGIISLAPGDFVDSKANQNMSAEKMQQLKTIYGLDKPVPIRYINWAKNVVTGNFGDSLRYRQPVAEVINTYVWNSFILAAASFLFCIIIGIPIGIVSAVKQYSGFDKILTLFTFVTLSLPAFFVGLVAIKIFSLNLGLFPIGGMTTAGSKASGIDNFIDILKHMFLPFITLTIVEVGTIIRYVRTSMLEVIRQDYIRTARAKGLKEKVVIYKHALRNGMIPVITYIGLSIPGLFAGAIITETIFVWPGIGNIAYQAILNRDYPLLMGFTMFMAILTLLGNLLSDVLYAVVDPRIKL
ncbi:ABC transporter permease [uncultured Clostridium sp.]|uniref:ABC transporter permease n=1 Tax=uncultured Clostridium sp. TaxID=59620 RepID=UPI0028EA960D|nr:ABC transporter permease [uncultured Clostridium sp.]